MPCLKLDFFNEKVIALTLRMGQGQMTDMSQKALGMPIICHQQIDPAFNNVEMTDHPFLPLEIHWKSEL